MDKEHEKKMIAPILVAVLIGAYLIFLGVLFLCIPGIPLWINLLIAAVPAVSMGVLIFVLVERIDEIRSGEEDDLSKY